MESAPSEDSPRSREPSMGGVLDGDQLLSSGKKKKELKQGRVDEYTG